MSFFKSKKLVSKIKHKNSHKNKTPTFTCVCGISGSGKSTFIDLYKTNDTIIVSTDDIREKIFGDAKNQENNSKVFAIAFYLIKTALIYGNSVLFEATNLTASNRKWVLKQIKDCNANKIVFYFDTPLEQALANNQKRDRQVPDDVIEKQFKKYRHPSYKEGWDKIYKISSFDIDGECINCEEISKPLETNTNDDENNSITVEKEKVWFELPRGEWQNTFCAFLDDNGFDMYGYRLDNMGIKPIGDNLFQQFENDTFILRPYYWGESDEVINLSNFVYKPKNIEICWYKYPLRGAYSNVELTFDEFKDIISDCDKSVKNMTKNIF